MKLYMPYFQPWRSRFTKEIGIVLLVDAVVVIGVICLIASTTISPYSKNIITQDTSPITNVGLVLGAGITSDNKPYKELQARLDVAADAIQDGTIEKLILSGDNRFENYNEPDAMIQYLIKERGIEAAKLQPDYAGRSTYESCERAAKIFDLKQVTIFSAGSHLPRAIYLCESFGITAYGVSSGVEANNSGRRELLARVKALYNVHLFGEKTILGDKILVGDSI